MAEGARCAESANALELGTLRALSGAVVADGWILRLGPASRVCHMLIEGSGMQPYGSFSCSCLYCTC